MTFITETRIDKKTNKKTLKKKIQILEIILNNKNKIWYILYLFF